MKLKILLTAIFAGCCLFSKAQSRIKYHGLVQAGLIHGVQDPGFLLQTIQGVKYKTWALGLGAGIDDYFRNSAPLFIDLRKKIFDRPNSPFLFADFGKTVVFDETESNMYMNSIYSGRRYYDIGVGYQWAMEKNAGFNISVGYSQKNITQTTQYTYSDPNSEVMKYTFRRLTLKAGLSF